MRISVLWNFFFRYLMTINNDGMTYEEKKTNWMSCYSFDDANQIKYAVKKRSYSISIIDKQNKLTYFINNFSTQGNEIMKFCVVVTFRKQKFLGSNKHCANEDYNLMQINLFCIQWWPVNMSNIPLLELSRKQVQTNNTKNTRSFLFSNYFFSLASCVFL